MLRSARISVTLAAVAITLAGCSSSNELVSDSPLPQHSDFEVYFGSILGDYMSYKTHKALAVAVEADGKFVFAYEINARNEEVATGIAMQECGKRAGWFAFKAKCSLYAVDNQVIWQSAVDSGSVN